MAIEQDIQMVTPPDTVVAFEQPAGPVEYGVMIFVCDDPSKKFINTPATITPHELPSRAATLQDARQQAARALRRHRALHNKYKTTPCTPTTAFGQVEIDENTGQVRWIPVTS